MTNDQAPMTNETANCNDQSNGKQQTARIRTRPFLLFAFCCLIGHCLLPFAV
jgi:hypothetical protein